MRANSIINYQILLYTTLTVISGCSAASVSRIGPTLSPRSPDCDVEILEAGTKPTRPYRDVGVVSLKNCQDYRTRPCRDWLAEAVCRLGGHVAYVDEGSNRIGQFGPANQQTTVTYRVMAAAYASEIYGPLGDDPIYRSRTCEPPCGKGKACVDGECAESAAPCQEGTETFQRCTE